MAQGWTISNTTETITFYEPPGNGAAIQVTERPTGSSGATDVWALAAWSPGNGYPREVEFFGDRLVFAGTPAQPQSLWWSKAGSYVDFGRTSPIADDDAIAATLNARQQNAIRELVPLDRLLLLTTGGEWKTTGGQDDVITPSTVAFKPQSYHGASKIPAVVIGNTALFVQNRGYVVRDIGYTFETDGYAGTDLTVFSSHLTEGKPIKSWAYQQVPFSIVWVVREDGVLLALTYMRDQEVVGWTPMEVDGFVESVTTVPEGGEDGVYVVIRREVNGESVRYVERLASRLVQDVRYSKFLDCHLTRDGRGDGVVTMTATGAEWAVGDRVTLTASADYFGPDWIEDVVVLGYWAGVNARLRVVEYVSATEVITEIDTPVPEEWRNVATTAWGGARDAVVGLAHLVGRTVGILCDGMVQDPRVVVGGQVTLDEPGVVVTIGLPYTSYLETLEINVPGAETPLLRNKVIKRLGLIVQDTRSIWAGPDFDHLDEHEPRGSDLTLQTESMLTPPLMQQGRVEMWVQGSWTEKGRVCVRQTDPLPMGVLGVVMDTEFER